MAHALRLAARGLTTTHPNPRVGCLLWRGGEVIGEGWHHVAGDAHAEILALRAAGKNAAGATAFVTLEPCAHHGRTAPCTDALQRARVARVVVAMQDPFPQVAGRGIAALRAAGITVDVGLLENAARALNEGFLSRIERARPFLRVKLAASLDGATAMRSGESQWITGTAARRDVQRLRARSDAILTGIGTVLADNPELTVRDIELPRAGPLRVVIDSRLQTPPAASILAGNTKTLLCCIDDEARPALETDTVEVRKFAASGLRVPLDAVLTELAHRQINEVLVEAGPRLAGAFIEQGLVDELVIYQAPHIMGSETRPLLATPAWDALLDRLQLDITDRRRIGADTRITARPVQRTDAR